MKTQNSNVKRICAICAICGFVSTSAVAASTVIAWYVDTERLTKQDIEIRRGETIVIETRYRSYGIPLDLTNTTNVLLYYKATGQTNLYTVTGSVYSATSGYVRVLWTPASEKTNSAYNYEISLNSSNGVMTRSYGEIKLVSGVANP